MNKIKSFISSSPVNSRLKQSLVTTLGMFGLGLVSTSALADSNLDQVCKSYILQENTTGTVIKSLNPTLRLPPASMVKLMTVYTILSRLDSGDYKLDDKITVSAAASRIGGSQVYLKEGEVFTVQQLLEALMVQSANDAAHALAEFSAGSVDEFVKDMNRQAKKIGLDNSEFQSPHGLPASSDRSEDLATAEDFSKLARILIKRFPTILELSEVKEKPFRDGTFIMRNHNHLIGKSGIDGLKTGYHSGAGFNLTATGKKNGVRFISVTMGCEQRKQRDALTLSLIREGIAKYRKYDFSEDLAPETLATDVVGGVPADVPVALAEPLKAIVPSNRKSDVKVLASPCKKVVAPFESGLTCGNVKLVLDDIVLKEVSLLTELGSRKFTFFEKIKSKIGLKIQ